MRGLIPAFQLLTRLPMPVLRVVGVPAQAAGWFPLVGLVVGGLVALPLLFVPDPRLAALLALLLWVWVTGGLHLDGLADLADALGAVHKATQQNRARFLAVLADPHVGSFGVIALVLQLMTKFVLLWLLAEAAPGWLTLLLIPALIAAWARLGALAWGQTLPPLKPGLGARFAWAGGRWISLLWLLALLAISLLWLPALCVAPLLLAGWGLFLRQRLGGMSGDCLGAGIEGVESLLLLAAWSLL